MKIRFIIITIVCFLSIVLHAQSNMEDWKGQILDAESNKPIEFVLVRIPELSLWTFTDYKGNFVIKGIKEGVYTYEVSLLGYQKATGEIVVRNNGSYLQLKLHLLSLALPDIKVTAEQNHSGSSFIINTNAIEHLQPKSLDDLLQYIPGNITKNPNLNAVAQAYIREIGTNNNNAFGTYITVDGAPLSNDANLQGFYSTRNGTYLNSQPTIGGGVDLRIISPDNISSVEVIRGIPSAEYGNLTSGAILVNTKFGITPLESKAIIDPFSKMFYVGKGLSLGGRRGSINLSADYSQSYEDIRKKYEGFERVTTHFNYSNLFMQNSFPLSLRVNMSYFRNVDSQKSDPQLKKKERVENRNTGFRFNINGDWRLNRPLITNLSYNLLISYSNQKDAYHKNIVLPSGITPISDSYVSQEYQSSFLNSSYYSTYYIEGKPLNLFAQLKVNKLIQFDKGMFLMFKYGMEWKYDANKGSGLVFDPLYPPYVSENQSVRPRSFKSIPAMNQWAYYIETKYKQPLRTTTLNVQAGMRLTHLLVDHNRRSDQITTVEPRFNLEYNILNSKNNSIFDYLSFVGGFGLAGKMPSLSYLYPEKVYFDATSFSAFLNGDITNGMCIMTTDVVDDISNSHLKPAMAHKVELGMFGRIKNKSAHINFFYEKTKNEFGYSVLPHVMPYRLYHIPTGVSDLSYSNGALYYDKENVWSSATFTTEYNLNTYESPSNTYETQKKGIEYNLNLGEISFIKTTFIVDGAWLRIKRKQTKDRYKNINVSYIGGNFPYIPCLPAGEGTQEERINTNFRFITHIPRLRMVFSTTAQVIWRWTQQNIYKDKQGRNLYYKAKDPLSGNVEKYFVNPIGFIDKDKNFYPWKDEYNTQFLYHSMVNLYGHDNYFGKESFPVSFLLNFRLTKEFGNWAELSFIANNFLKIKKRVKNQTFYGYTQVATPLYFGAELKLKF